MDNVLVAYGAAVVIAIASFYIGARAQPKEQPKRFRSCLALDKAMVEIVRLHQVQCPNCKGMERER